MLAITKWTIRLLVAILVLFALVALLAYYLGSRSLPDYDGEITLETGDYNVEILRDRYAIPHIYGARDEDVEFGLGYAHAQERLWQMTMLRRAAQGRLSEIFGEELLETDQFLRALDLWNLAGRNASNLDPKLVDHLQSYADGVNAYITEITREKRGAGGPEFLIFGRQITPWSPQDSLSIQKIMALQLSGKAENEILRTKLANVIGIQSVNSVFFDTPLPRGLTKYTQFTPNISEPSNLARVISPTGYGKSSGASNAFAAAPNRSANGSTLLGSDPHLTLNAPSIWYLAQLHSDTLKVQGATIPGLPAVVIGHNETLSWGLTTANLDDQDLVILQLTDDGQGYITKDGPVPFTSERVLINVKERSDPVEFIRLMTQYGPVIPANGPWGVGEILPDGHMAALAWTALDEDDQTFRSAHELMRAKNVSEAVDAIQYFQAPSNVFTLADADGNIGQIASGKMPMRSAENPSQGRIPAASWLGDAGFDGYLSYAKNPRAINPDSGLLMHTNNKFVEKPYPEHFSFDWGDNYRIVRAQELLGNRSTHSTSSFMEAQNDTVSEDVRALLPLIARDVWFKPNLTGQKKQALDLMGDWNGRFDALGSEGLIYATWFEELARLIFEDELGVVYEDIGSADPLWLERVFRNVGGAVVWCDIKPTPEIETCAQISEIALDRTLERLSAKYGNNIESWRWGRAHLIMHESEVMGQVPIIGGFANVIHEGSGGNETLLRAAYRNGKNFDFTSTHGAGVRMVVDFADINRSKMIISTGQSGNLLSSHYDDLSVLWRNGEYLEMPMERAEVENNLQNKLVILPAE